MIDRGHKLPLLRQAANGAKQEDKMAANQLA